MKHWHYTNAFSVSQKYWNCGGSELNQVQRILQNVAVRVGETSRSFSLVVLNYFALQNQFVMKNIHLFYKNLLQRASLNKEKWFESPFASKLDNILTKLIEKREILQHHLALVCRNKIHEEQRVFKKRWKLTAAFRQSSSEQPSWDIL